MKTGVDIIGKLKLLYRIPIYAIRIGLLAPLVFSLFIFPENWIQWGVEKMPKKLGLTFNGMMDFLESL